MPAYHENQFGAALGLPLLRNKLFLFARCAGQSHRLYRRNHHDGPSLLERAGNFSELFNPALTGASGPHPALSPEFQRAAQPFPNNNLASGIAGVMPNATALAILNLLPKPNTNNGLLYNNYLFNSAAYDDTTQWDTRLDWNINAKDTAYSSFSYWNEPSYQPPLFGILAGGGNISGNISGSFMFSETHIFSHTLTNEFRVGFNNIRSHRTQFNAANAGFAASLGFGGIPAGYMNGGIPQMWFSGGAFNIANFGSGGYTPGTEKENVYQIIDNVTKIVGNHALKAGVNFLSIRFSSQEPPSSRGNYYYTGEYTSNLNAPNTGFAAADFLLDSQNSAVLSSEFVSGAGPLVRRRLPAG